MFKNMSIEKKIVTGFAIVIIFLIIIAVISIYTISNGSSGFQEYRGMARENNSSAVVQRGVLSMRLNVKNFVIHEKEIGLKEYSKFFESAKTELANSIKEFESEEVNKVFKDVEEKVITYNAQYTLLRKVVLERNLIINNLDSNGPLMEKTLTKILKSAKKDGDIAAAYNAGIVMRNLLLARLYVIKFLEHDKNTKAIDRVKAEFDEMGENIAVLDKELENQSRRALLETLLETKTEYLKSFDELLISTEKKNEIIDKNLDVIGPEVKKAIVELGDKLKSQQDILGPQLEKSNENAQAMILYISIFIIIICILFAIFIARGVSKSMNEKLGGTVDSLSNASEQITLSSDQMTTSSQKLSDQATTQASALEEITASLEEVSAMTKNNQDITENANELTDETKKLSTTAASSMSELY